MARLLWRCEKTTTAAEIDFQEQLMARRVKSREAAEQAKALLDQAVMLLDVAHLDVIAVHADMARQLLDQYLCAESNVAANYTSSAVESSI